MSKDAEKRSIDTNAPDYTNKLILNPYEDFAFPIIPEGVYGMTIADAAEAYLSMGRVITPLQAVTGIPRDNHWFDPAARTEYSPSWWTSHTDDGIAIILGPSGLGAVSIPSSREYTSRGVKLEVITDSGNKSLSEVGAEAYSVKGDSEIIVYNVPEDAHPEHLQWLWPNPDGSTKHTFMEYLCGQMLIPVPPFFSRGGQQ